MIRKQISAVHWPTFCGSGNGKNIASLQSVTYDLYEKKTRDNRYRKKKKKYLNNKKGNLCSNGSGPFSSLADLLWKWAMERRLLPYQIIDQL